MPVDDFVIRNEAHALRRRADALIAKGGKKCLAGCHSLFTCVRCEASVRDAQERLRNALIESLMSAAKHLAERQFTRQRSYGKLDLICVECRTPQVADSKLRHDANCATGRVLMLLNSLAQVDDPALLGSALNFGSGLRVFHSFPLAGAKQGGVQ